MKNYKKLLTHFLGGKKMAPRKPRSPAAAGAKKKPRFSPVGRRVVNTPQGPVEVLDIRRRQVVNPMLDQHVNVGGGSLTYSHSAGGSAKSGMPPWAKAALTPKKKKKPTPAPAP